MTLDPSAVCEGQRSPASPLRVVVADDNVAMLQRLKAFVETLGSFAVIATADNGHDAWALIRNLRPDLALLDFQMPGLTGAEIAGRVRSEKLATQVLILSLFDGPEVCSCCLAAGADGFVSKHHVSSDLGRELARLTKQNRDPKGQST